MFGGSSCCSYGNKRLVIDGGMGRNVCKARMGFGCIVCRGLPLGLKAMTKMKKIARHLIANQIILKLFNSICSLSDPAHALAPDQLVMRQPATYSTRIRLSLRHQTRLALLLWESLGTLGET